MDEPHVYQMVNKENGARIECTKKFLFEWIAKGFEIESIRVGDLIDEGE